MKYSPGTETNALQNGGFMEAAGIEPAQDSPGRPGPQPGYVYVVLQENTGLIKIGTTRDLESRLRSLKHEHGDVQLLTWVDGDEPEERRLHKEYADERVHGEWFDSDRLLIDALDGRIEEKLRHPIHTAGRYFACHDPEGQWIADMEAESLSREAAQTERRTA